MDQAPLYNSKRCAVVLMALAAAYPVVQAQSRDFGAIGASTAAGTSVVSKPGTYAVQGGRSDITTRQRARFDERIQSAMVSWEQARQYYKEEKYEESLKEYKQALDILPNAPVTEDRRKELVLQTGNASVAVAQQYRKVGRYDEARELLHEALRIDPGNKYALRELTFLDDPIRSNPALTPRHAEDVGEVNKLLNMGYGYFDLGRYDEAIGEFTKVLRIDKYNEAARRGQEKALRRKSQYYRAAYAETRAELLTAVDQAWEMAVPMEAIEDAKGGLEDGVTPKQGAVVNMQKLRNIIIPRVDFEDTPVEDAIQFLRQRSVELDTSTSGTRGINFVISDSAGGGTPAANTGLGTDIGGLDVEDDLGMGAAPAAPQQDVKSRRIKELKLNDVPMLEVLNFICQNTGLRLKVEDYAVNILPAGGVDYDLYTRTFVVPADFISQLEAAAGGGGGPDPDPFGSQTASSGIGPKRSAQELLKELGIPFESPASATYSAGKATLLVRNTNANLDMIESIIEQTISPQRQVKIETKFVEINQNNTDELGFDWVVTPFSINDSRKTFLSGGTDSNSGRDIGDFVGNPGGVNGWPISNSATGSPSGLGTGGNRSGSGAIKEDSLNGLINSVNRTEAAQNNPAPGIMALTGIYDEGSFQMIMRGLSQKKGTDVLTAPSIIVRPIDGMTGKIEIIREFIYPTDYEPPEIPSSMGNNNSDRNYGNTLGGLLGGGQQATVNSYPVTPATPSQWETRSVGVTLEVAANVSENSYIIDLEFKPEIVEFEGFVNYGSPIQSTGVGSDGRPVSVVLTENRIEMPIFSTRRVDTKAYIYDGHTVGIGGLITESVQIVEDKVPVFGDLPFVGRFFRSNAENHNKTNLMIFVTATVVDATGQPIRGRNAATGLPVSGDMDMMDDTLLPPTP